MRSRRFWGWLGLALLGAGQVASAATTTVNEFAPYTATPTAGVWTQSDDRIPTYNNSTMTTVALAGEPTYGNLQSAAPLGPGAAKLTTANTDQSIAEVGVFNDYGKVSDLLAGNFSVSYSFLAHAGASGNTSTAPSLKLTFVDPSTNDRTTLIYEHYWNATVAQDTWTTATINATSGKFWTNGGFGQSGSAGGPPLRTLTEWSGVFSTNFLANAHLVSVRIGLGTYNKDQTGYFDKVVIGGTAFDATYDFEPTPEPSTLALGGIAAGLFALQALRRRRSARG